MRKKKKISLLKKPTVKHKNTKEIIKDKID
jgi:hypothetical protein